jgi:hypothetical protein
MNDEETSNMHGPKKCEEFLARRSDVSPTAKEYRSHVQYSTTRNR